MSRPDHSDATDSHADRAERKERYHAVLRTVGHNTTETQGPGAPEQEIVLILAGHGRYTGDGVRTSIQAAVENNDVLRWTGPRGDPRYTLVTEADLERLFHYGIDEYQWPVEHLRRLIGVLTEHTDPAPATVGWANHRLNHYAEDS